MSGHRIVEIVESVDSGAESAKAKTAALSTAETTAAGTTFRLRGREKSYKIPREDRYFALHTDIVTRRQGEPVFVETKGDDEVVSRVLVPKLRQVVEVLVSPVSVEVRTQDSPLKLVMTHDLFKEKLEGWWKDKAQKGNPLLITDDPETHVILDITDPFDASEDGALAETPRKGPEPLSLKMAMDVFERIAGACEIPFDYPDEYCNARAHQMFRLLQRENVACEKIWNFGNEGNLLASRIRVFTPNHPDGLVPWIFHVAVVVRVQLPNEKKTVVDMVFDPSLVGHPIRIPDWVALQHDSSAVQERTSPEIYGQEPGGKCRRYDHNFKNTDASLKKAREELRDRLLKQECESSTSHGSRELQ